MNTKLSFNKGLFVGIASTVILLSSIPSVGALPPYYKDIKALVSSINIVVDGKVMNQDVEPLLIEGTTYLPLRAIGETLGKEVKWDGATNSVFIGNTDNFYRPSIGISQLVPIYGETYLHVGYNEDYWNLGYGGDDYIQPFEDGGRITLYKQKYNPEDSIAFLNDSSVAYHLYDNKYNRIYGLAGVDDSNPDGEAKGIVKVYGDGKELATIKTGTKQEQPVTFDIDITGIEKIELKNMKADGSASRVALVEVMLDAVQD